MYESNTNDTIAYSSFGAAVFLRLAQVSSSEPSRSLIRSVKTSLPPNIYGDSRVKFTSPDEAPPEHVPLMLPVGQMARAARTHCSQRPLEILILAPFVAVVSVNLALPDCPVVASGAPPHLVIEPEMPPQMPSSATFWSWKTMLLRACQRPGR